MAKHKRYLFICVVYKENKIRAILKRNKFPCEILLGEENAKKPLRILSFYLNKLIKVEKRYSFLTRVFWFLKTNKNVCSKKFITNFASGLHEWRNCCLSGLHQFRSLYTHIFKLLSAKYLIYSYCWFWQYEYPLDTSLCLDLHKKAFEYSI